MSHDSNNPFDPSEDPIDDEFPEFEESSLHSEHLEEFDTSSARAPLPPAKFSASSEDLHSFETFPTDKIDLAKVPIEIELEVARINVSLDELQRMEPGHKLPINVNPRIIDLIVHGKSIGKGEIVEIGDAVGVRIIELYR